jgi:transposase-like protein
MEGLNSDARMTRGLEISKTATIAENEDGSFTVPSQTSNSSYQVKLLGATWVCTCPDFENRADQIEMCKHAFALKFWIAAKVELQQAPKPKVFSDDAVQCAKCGSIRVVRFGHENGKQVFKCKDCGKKSREGLLKNAQYSPETITLTLDLYFSGLSLRKITRTLNDHFDMNLGKSTVYRWIEAFVPKISEYVNSLKPQLSDTWHADELFVKMKGGVKDTQYNQKNMAYLWNIMDRKTRFLIASRLSEKRDSIGAMAAFNRAIRVAHGSEPEKVLTDAAPAYNDGIRRTFEKRPQHIARVGIGKPHANNNRIERLNGTLRERVKVQRGWKSMKTQLAEGARIQYNFVKPHAALDGQTPAQVAGIGIEGENKWMELLTKGLKLSQSRLNNELSGLDS